MEILLLLTVLVLGLVVALMMKRKKEQDKLPKNLSVKQARPRTMAPQPAVETPSVQEGVSSQSAEASVAANVLSAETVTEPVESLEAIQEVAASSPLADKEETTPEDSTLRRHYLSTRQAEKEAISNPYPTDSTLRRHYDSMYAVKLDKSVVAGKKESVGQAVKKLHIPEDSTLRRHFLAQLQAEIESHLCAARPTDSTLRRHYDSQVKAKMEEYLLKLAA